MDTVRAERGVCQGYGNCAIAAPAIFDVDDDGLVVVLNEQISADERLAAAEAVASCPMSALTLEPR